MAPKKKNPFYMFMLEKKPEIEKQLKRKVSFAELPELLYDLWKNLSEEDKLFYKKKCKSANQSMEKCDSRGIPLSYIQQQEEAKHKKELDMKKNIKISVDMLKTGKSIANGNFFVIHIAYYVHLEDDTHVPAEIGVVQFSFVKGVTSSFHRIFPAKIPVGYHYEAIKHSDETHNLMLGLTKAFQKNFIKFENELFMFLLKDGTKLPNIYTQNDVLESVESMLSNFKFRTPLKVYSLDCLYQHLYSASIRDIPESISSHTLQSCEFDFAPKISCQWHENFAPNAIKYCSLSICHRWVFNMCNSIRLQDTFGVIPEKGKHFPDFGNTERVVAEDIYQASFSSHFMEEEEKIPSASKSSKVAAFDSVFDDEDFDAEMDNLKISDPPSLKGKEKEQKKSSPGSDSGCGIGVNYIKTKEIGGIPIGCLGLSGFGRGKRKPKNQ